MRKLFRYLEPLWQGADGKISLRSSLAIVFSVDFVRNLSHAIYKWEAGRSLESLALLMGIEAGLIAALLGLTTYQNIAANNVANSTPNIVVQDGGTANSNTTKAEVVQTENIENATANTITNTGK